MEKLNSDLFNPLARNTSILPSLINIHSGEVGKLLFLLNTKKPQKSASEALRMEARTGVEPVSVVLQTTA